MNQEEIRRIFNSGLSRNEQISELLQLRYPRREIMTMVGCGPNVITNVRKSLDLTGSPPPQAKIGRPTKKSPEVKAFIKQKTINEPYISGEDLKTQIQQSMNISIGSSTVNDIRSDQGFKFLPPLHQPNLTDMQIQKRLNFCYSILIHRHEL